MFTLCFLLYVIRSLKVVMNNNSVGKGVAYLYIESITMLFSGYIYWLIISKITDPAIIGTSSTVISVVTIFVSIASIGVSGGIQRFIGKRYYDQQFREHKKDN